MGIWVHTYTYTLIPVQEVRAKLWKIEGFKL